MTKKVEILRKKLNEILKEVRTAIDDLEIQDGPNEKEKEFLKGLITEHLITDHIPTMDKEYRTDCVECWKLKKLEQAWGMK